MVWFDLVWLLTYGGVHKLCGQNRMLVIIFHGNLRLKFFINFLKQIYSAFVTRHLFDLVDKSNAFTSPHCRFQLLLVVKAKDGSHVKILVEETVKAGFGKRKMPRVISPKNGKSTGLS